VNWNRFGAHQLSVVIFAQAEKAAIPRAAGAAVITALVDDDAILRRKIRWKLT
jgi:hypothetical protein